MKKKRLDIAYTLDFDIYGITSTAKGYKLAWELNHALGTTLVKMDDYEIEHKNSSANNYLHFAQTTDHILLKLLKNQPNEEHEARNLLLPEHPRFDFILLTRGEAFADRNRLQELLRKIPSIGLIAFIPLAALKSKENFIF